MVLSNTRNKEVAQKMRRQTTKPKASIPFDTASLAQRQDPTVQPIAQHVVQHTLDDPESLTPDDVIALPRVPWPTFWRIVRA